MKRAAYSTALIPCGAIAEWQARPRKVSRAALLPLWPTTHAHLGRLAHEAAERPQAPRAHPRDQRAHAEAADLLVVREGDVDRAGEPRRRHLGHQRQADRDEALHVRGAAPVEAPVALGQPERVARPGLPRHRHDVAVPGEHVARHVPRAERDPERGFSPVSEGTRSISAPLARASASTESTSARLLLALTESKATSLSSVSMSACDAVTGVTIGGFRASLDRADGYGRRVPETTRGAVSAAVAGPPAASDFPNHDPGKC